MRIFVIDDEVEVAETLGEIVADLGHHASVAHTAGAALTALEREAPDAILLDIYLPDMDGLEFLRRRRLRQPNTPVIGISGQTTEAKMWECLRLGALDFVRKPVSFDLLAALILYVEARRPGRTIGGPGFAEHRRSARVQQAMPVAVVEHGGSTLQTVSIDLSAFGAKLRPRPGVRPAEHARLSFILPDGGPSLDLCAVLARENPRAWAYRFVNFASDQFERLQRVVADLTVRPATPLPAQSASIAHQPSTLRILRQSWTDAGYMLTFDAPGVRLQSRRCMTDNDLLRTLTALRVNPGIRMSAMLELAAVGSTSIRLGLTAEELRSVGFTPIATPPSSQR